MGLKLQEFEQNLIDIHSQGGHWSGKSQGNLIFLQGQGKVREFCKLVREILNIKKVLEKSWNFIIWSKNIWVVAARYFVHFYAPPPESDGVLCYTLRNFECPSVRLSVCPSVHPSAPTTILVSTTPPTVLGQSF